MDIVLDANALIADFTLSSTAFRVLFDGAPRLDARLCLAAVTVEEAVRKFRVEVIGLTKATERLQRLIAKPLDLTSLRNCEDLVSEYRARLGKRFVILPIPAVPHDKVIERVLSERSPARSGDRGYRDTLIWETVLERLATHQRKILFVTNDGDFADKSGQPHPDLLSDLDERGVHRERFKIYKVLSELNKERIEPHLAVVQQIEALLKNDTFPNFCLRDWFEETIPAHKGMWVGGRSAGRVRDWDVSVDSFAIEDVTVTDVKGLEDEDVYVQAEATFDARFRVSSDLVDEEPDSDRYRDSLHGAPRRYPGSEARRDGSYVAYAELILQADGEIVSAEIYGVDKLA